MFDWFEYLLLAKDLAGQAVGAVAQEAKLRSAISRAYYALYCTARNRLYDIDGVRPTSLEDKRNEHAFVRDRFTNDSDYARRKIGIELGRLRNDRNKADYNNSLSGLTPLAAKAILSAEATILQVQSL